jgi:hypothetical protein
MYWSSLYLELHEPGAALERLRAALPILRAECPDNEGFALAVQGLAYAQLGSPEARHCIEQATIATARYRRKGFHAFLAIVRATFLKDGTNVPTGTDQSAVTLVALAKRLLGKGVGPAQTTARGQVLVLGAQGAWFRVANESHSQDLPAVQIGTRKALRAMLLAVAKQHERERARAPFR